MTPGLRAVGGLLADASAVVLAWLGALLVENVVVGVAQASELTTAWEAAQIKRVVVPMALAGLAPASLVVVAGWRLAAARTREARLVLALAGLVASGALALGVTHGRHFASWAARGPFVALVAVAGAAAGAYGLPRLAALGARPGLLAATGLGVAVAGWLGDVHLLPRLYGPLHVSMLAASLAGAAAVGIALRLALALEGRPRAIAAAAVGALVAAAVARTPSAARALEPLGNLRVVLVEHAPMLGRAVAIATSLRTPDAEPVAAAEAAFAPGEVARALDWTGHDLVLLSVDALRADHVSAYGYGRATTPHLDELARQGTLFEAAYCPTPHTSYSLTSMMTGKYLRPLLALGLGQDSETWAQDLRRYGFRTAAFYPPAVFFIDEDRFPSFEQGHLGFEYAKVEFADPALREQQVAGYLDSEPAGRPLFLWVHFFEPHEPYVAHPEHPFAGGPSADVDAYDSEVATADEGIGRVVALVRARRPGAVVMVTADHGEEFGEHGGRYHGTTVYEEQVRVPLVVAGAGVARGARVADVVQTIDLLPTTLSALAIPRPARVRGRDLGGLLAAGQGGLPPPGGFAFAETDDYALVASGPDRLVCQRRAAACSLYRPAQDPLEQRDLAAADPSRFAALRDALRAVERDGGRYEAATGGAWPEALRRGMMGDAEAAVDVAALLDDADVRIRRKAAEVAFELRAPGTLPGVRRALARDEDEEVRRWAALAVTRLGDPPPALAQALLRDGFLVDWRRRAALAVGARGDGRACEALATWWSELAPAAAVGRADAGDGEPPRLPLDLPHARDLLEATTAARCKGCVPGLLLALADVRARPYVADALGALGDERAREPLRALLASEPYVTTRPHEARALLAIGAREWAAASPQPEVRATLPAAAAGPLRLLALVSDASSTLEGTVDGRPVPPAPADGAVRAVEVPASHGRSLAVELRVGQGGIVALWVAPVSALD